MASKELFLLLRILDERNTGLRRDDVVWAFEPPRKAETEAWVREYISPHTLLSKEEHAFFEHVGQELPKSDASRTGRPLSDDDFEHAITSLESSTAAIEKQCQLMESQKRALAAMTSRNATPDSPSPPSHHQHKLARDKAQLDLELDEVSTFLQSRLRSALKQTDSAVANLPPTIQRLLEKDDRQLANLQKILPKLATSPATDTALLTEIDTLCQTFTTLEAKAIRARIDATYLRHTPNPRNGNGISRDAQESALLTELEELSSEIPGLASLVAETYYKLPLSAHLRFASTQQTKNSSLWSEYVASVLRFLARRLETLDQHFEHVHAHRMALGGVSGALEEVLALPKGEGQDVAQSAAKTPLKGLKPLRLVQENISEAVEPTAQLLQLLDVRNSGVRDGEKLALLLGDVREERRERLEGVEVSVEEQMGRELVGVLDGAEGDLGEVMGAVLEYTRFGAWRVGDERVQELVGELEGRTQGLGERMRGFDLEGLGAEVKRAQRLVLDRSRT